MHGGKVMGASMLQYVTGGGGLQQLLQMFSQIISGFLAIISNQDMALKDLCFNYMEEQK